MQDFQTKLSEYINQNRLIDSRNLMLQELGRILVKHKSDFVALLNECGISANENMSDEQLVDLYSDNIVNRKLLLGTSFLIHSHNTTVGIDGEDEVNNEAVQTSYEILTSSFSGDENDLQDEDFANAGGGVVGAIAGAVGEASKFGSNIAQNQRTKKYGAQDLATKRLDAKTQLTQSVIAQKQAQIEANKKAKEQSAKTTRTILIVSGIVVGLGLIATAFYLYKKNKK